MSQQSALDDEVLTDPQGRWWTTLLNRLPSVQRDAQLPRQVLVRDCTLREGEETGGIILPADKKILIAVKLQELGFAEIEIGYAGAIDEHYELVGSLRKAGVRLKLVSINRTYTQDHEWRREIERAVESGVDGISFVGFSSDSLLASVPWLKKEAVPDRVAACLFYARSLGVDASFSLAGITRTSLPWIDRCYRAAVEAGASQVSVADSQGVALPEAVAFMVSFLRQIVGPNVRIGVHAHNTFGLATANALAGVRSGAESVDGVVLGLGEGAGIAATEELVFGLEVLYGISTGVTLERLHELCELVRSCLGVPISPTKPIVGPKLYHHSIDSHIASMLRGQANAWEVIRPDVVGKARKLEFSRGKIRRGPSGAIGAKLSQMGLTATDETLDRVYGQILELAEAKGTVTEEEVEEAIRRFVSADGYEATWGADEI